MSNNGWTVTEDSISAMNNLSSQLNEKLGEISKEVLNVINVYEENKDGLGNHSAEILALLKEVNSTTDDASGPVKELVKKLSKAAAIRKAHIDTNIYGGKSR